MFSALRTRIALLFCGLISYSSLANAFVQESVEVAAEKLLGATVTIRIAVTKDAPSQESFTNETAADKAAAVEARSKEKAANKTARGEPALPEEVIVCSGVSLGNGRIVTFHHVAANTQPRFRVTLPMGDQAEAKLRVIDRPSGLVLLEIESRELAGLSLAERLPKVGGAVVTAAAAGLEQPAISSGVLGAVDRSLAGVDLPPLLQCDLRTTETSSGAAVTDREGNLLGIVVAATAPGKSGSWTYALPVRHVKRLLASYTPDKVMELKRRRPVVGFTIGAGEKEGTVVVEKVEKTGPAAAAGIVAGDQLVETDGLRIRSAYQAIDLIVKKQPGDAMTFTIERAGARKVIELTLDGGALPTSLLPLAAWPPDPSSNSLTRPDGTKNDLVTVGPQLKASTGSRGQITVRNTANAEEVAVDPNQRLRKSPGDEVEMLRLQLGAYERVIESMQKEISTLRRETSELKKQAAEKTK